MASRSAKPLPHSAYAALRRIQDILEKASGPISHRQVQVRLRGSVRPEVVEAALGFLGSLNLVADEGPGGRVLWIHNPSPRMRELIRRSKRMA